MTDVFLHDSAARGKRRFEPLDPQHVKLYVCGPTVYDLAHLGNARPVVVFDVLARMLRRLYPHVTYVRNITDVDDKINARARESGEPIAAIGNSNGSGGPPSYAPGAVTQLGASVRATNEAGGDSRELFDLIRVAAQIRPGDSGGPLVNSAGQVVGVTVAATLEFNMGGVSGGEGFAIPIDRAMAIANQIRAGAPAPGLHLGDSAFIGVGIADALPLFGPAGAVVRQVLPDTPAGRAGLLAGDVITAVDGIPVNSATDLSNIMDQRRPGNTVMLTWIDRFGNPRTVPVVLAKGPVG
jgi:S1-C subfamily serine protease